MSEDGWVALFSHAGKYNPLKAGSIDGTDTVAHDRGVIRAMCSRCKCSFWLDFHSYNTLRESVTTLISACLYKAWKSFKVYSSKTR